MVNTPSSPKPATGPRPQGSGQANKRAQNQKARNYASGVSKALFLLSRGRCYEPSCPRPVIREIDGEPIVDVEIAHIRAHSPDGPRFDPKMGNDERKSFANLILLCNPHHAAIDNNPNKYPTKLLIQWKKSREGELFEQLSGLENLTPKKLREMMSSAVTQSKNEIMHAIGELSEISEESAAILKKLAKENFSRPYIDIDAVESLADSTRRLTHLEETTVSLRVAAHHLGHLQDTTPQLSRAAENLERYISAISSLQSMTVDIDKSTEKINHVLRDRLHERSWEAAEQGIFETAEAIERTVDSINNLDSEIIIRDKGRWTYFLQGIIFGTCIGLAIFYYASTQLG